MLSHNHFKNSLRPSTPRMDSKKKSSLIEEQINRLSPSIVRCNRQDSLGKANSTSNIKRYLEMTSPVKNLKSLKSEDSNLKQYKNDFMMKLAVLKNNQLKKKGKNDSNFVNGALNSQANKQNSQIQNQPQFPKLKASSLFYHLPQFSPPEINFEVTEEIQKKMNEMTKDIDQHLPQILKSKNQSIHSVNSTPAHSSNYYTRSQIGTHFKERTRIIELQEWLKQNLKNPPKSNQACIEYKNMIMGIGMKELIRIITKRCYEEGKLIEEIWQATWAICREIIVFLGKRSHQCEKILEQEIQFIKVSLGKNMNKMQLQNNELKQKLDQLQQNCVKNDHEHNALKKKHKQLKFKHQKLEAQSRDYGEQYTKILQENLNLYLQTGNRQKRDWVKKVYKQLNEMKNVGNSKMMKQHALQAMQARFYQQHLLQTKKDLQKQKEFDIDEVEQQIKHQKQVERQIALMKNQVQVQATSLLKKQFQTFQNYCQTQKKQLANQETNTDVLQIQEKETYFQHQLLADFYVQAETNTEQVEKTSKKKNATHTNTPNKVGKKDNNSVQKRSLIAAQQNESSKNLNIVPINKSLKKILSESQNVKSVENGVQVQESMFARQLRATHDCECGKSLDICVVNEVIFIDGSKKLVQNSQTIFQELNSASNSNKDQKQRFTRVSVKNHRHSKQKSFDSNFSQSENHIIQEANDQTVESGVSRIVKQERKSTSKDRYKINLNGNKQKRVSQKSSILSDISFKNSIISKERLKVRGVSQEHEIAFLDQIQQEDINELEKQVSRNKDYYKVFSRRLLANNQELLKKLTIPSLVNQTVVQQYFQLAKEVLNGQPLNHTQKYMTSLIQKAVYPILSELLKTVKKAYKQKNLKALAKNFPSLPSVMMINFSRKYGVKTIAHKNMKNFLQSLRQIRKYTDKFSLIQLLMFTDCKKQTSEDLFVYLLLIGVFDHNFSNRVLSPAQLLTARKIAEEYLGNNDQIYKDFEEIKKDIIQGSKNSSNNSPGNPTPAQKQTKIDPKKEQNFKFMNVIKSIVSGYRIHKLQRIQQAGFIFLMLKSNKRQFLYFKQFVYFLSTLSIQPDSELLIAKKFLEFCDFKNRSDEIMMSQSAFSQFLVSCPKFNMQVLQNCVDIGKAKQYYKKNLQIIESLGLNAKISANQTQEEVAMLVKDIKCQNQHIYAQEKLIISEQQDYIQAMGSSKQQLNLNQARQSSEQGIEEITTNERKLDYLKNLNKFTGNIIDFLGNKKVPKSSLRSYQRQLYHRQSLTHRSSVSKSNSKASSQDSSFLTSQQRDFIVKYLIFSNLTIEIESIVGVADQLSFRDIKIQMRKNGEFTVEIIDLAQYQQSKQEKDKFHLFLDKQNKYDKDKERSKEKP